MGKIIVSNQSSPATPSSGTTSIYVDSTTKRLKTKDDTGLDVDYTPGGEANTASNVGAGSQVFKQKSGVDLQFRTLTAGTNVSLVQNANDIQISSTDTGEANTASNVGAGSQVFKQKTGVDLQFRTLTAGAGVTVTQNANDISIGSTATADPKAILQIYDDFMSGTEDTDEIGNYCWRYNGAGTGNAITRLTGVSGHPGIIRLQSGTVATSRSVITAGESGMQFMVLGDGTITLEIVARLTQANLALFSGAYLGLGDFFTAVGDQVNGVYFQLLGGVTPDTNWHLVTANTSVRTRLDTGVAYSSGSWLRFGFVVNAAASSIEGFINGTSVGTIVTNIPTASLSPLLKTDGIGAGVSALLDIDYYYMTNVFTTQR